MKTIKRATLLSLFTLSSSVFATQAIDNSLHIKSVKPATAVSKVNPIYPLRALERTQEGWVKLNYTVAKDGSVKDVFVSDSSGDGIFDSAAVTAMSKWEYSPATIDGEAVEQCKTDALITFKMLDGGSRRGVRKRFHRLYNKALDALEVQDFPQTEQYLAQIQEKDVWNLTEEFHKELLLATYYGKKKNHAKQLHTINRLIPEAKGYLSAASYRNTLVEGYIAALKRNNLSNASYFFQQLNLEDGAQQQIEKLQGYQHKIEQLINSNQLMITQATVGDTGNWVYFPIHKQFEFNQINGQLTSMDVRCSNIRQTFKIELGKMWTIPQHWQGCNLLIKGRQGTDFNLVEVPNPAISLTQIIHPQNVESLTVHDSQM